MAISPPSSAKTHSLVYVLCFFFSISSSMFLLLCSLFRRPRLLVVVGSVLHFLISFIKSYDFSQTFNGLAWLFLDVSTNISLLYKEEFDPSHNKLAVSREQTNEKGEKMYIQTRMAEYAEELWELLKKKTTPLFTCVVSRGGGGTNQVSAAHGCRDRLVGVQEEIKEE
ncbi:BnaC09g19030D [Brassica napus]|uniref:BnaC09g19030D protein n=1 Tax=Brassica napus TaxID=3708 RepID=A0A078GCT7_BRANA|nr:BnaC09g19030D [Brassica napus]